MSTTISRVQQTGLHFKSIWVLVTINSVTRLFEAKNVPIAADPTTYVAGLNEQQMFNAGVAAPVDTAQANVKAKWVASAIKGKTPDEIYTYLQGRINGWGSLNAAKADLAVWLPLMAAVLAWAVMEDIQQ